MADIMDILGGGLPPGLLSQEQEAMARQRAQQAGLTNLGFALLQASQGQPGQRKPSFGQIIGQAGPVGMQAYQQSFDKTLSDLVKGIQVKDLIEKRQREQSMREAIRGSYTTQPVAGLGLGVEQVQNPITQAEIEAFGPKSYLQAAETAAPKERSIDRDRLLSAIAEFAPEKYLELTQPQKSDLPSSVREYQFAVGQGYKGSFQDFVTEQKRAGATQVILPGDKKMAEVLGTKGAERLDSSLTQAQEAQATIQNISELRPIIKEGVFSGPLSSAPRTVTQIASSLGITGKDTNELLQRTATTMQGLAKFELSAAAAMRGQGQITENERVLIRRAAAGRLEEFTSTEIQALLTAMEKTANYRIESHGRQLDVLRKNASPEVKELLPFYELSPLNVSPVSTGDLPQNVKVRKK